MSKSPWRSFKTKGGGSCLRQDKRYSTGNNRSAAQKRASSTRKKK